jgi:dihydrofolate reductase
MNIIAAADRNWAIGKDGGLLYHLPQDMKFFRETTQNSVVVMGRKTLESFPGGRPLKNRVNIVLTRNKEYEKDGVIICHDADKLPEILKSYPEKEVFVIGGEEIYRLLLPMCNKAYITKIDKEADADSFFPNLDNDTAWHKTKISETFSDNGICFNFVVYERV